MIKSFASNFEDNVNDKDCNQSKDQEDQQDLLYLSPSLTQFQHPLF